MNKQQNINELFNYHFEKEVKEVPGKQATIGSVIKMKGLMDSPTPEQYELGVHFKSLKKRYSVSLDYFTTEDLLQEYASLFILIAQDLEILEDIDYLIGNPDIYKQRIRFIKDGIAREMYHVANPNKQRVRVSDGSYKYVSSNTTSLDTEIGHGDEATKLINLINEEQSIFYQGESHHNHFVQWFLDNREQLLTNKQLTTFEALKDIYQPKAGNTKEENEQRKLMLQDANLEARSMQKQFKNIKKRVTEKYEKEFDGIYHSHNYEGRKMLNDVMLEYVESADSPSWNTAEERQRELTGIIQEFYDLNEEFELIITRGLDLDEKKEIVRGVNGITLISHKVLRKINTNIKAELKDKEVLNITANYPKFDYKENMFSGLANIEGNNLTITPAGVVVAKDILQGV